MRASGISSPFGGLSRSPGWVPHVLLTRSPLDLPQQAGWISFDLHALSTPPAFVLSQDQTLHRDQPPERAPMKISVEPASPWRGTPTGTESASNFRCCPFQCIELTARRRRSRGNEVTKPALAFPSSLPLSRCAAPGGAGAPGRRPRAGVAAGMAGPRASVRCRYRRSEAKGHATGARHHRQLDTVRSR
jgi:hypothetical protein